MKFISKIQKFMYGRYGVDDLSVFLFIVYILLSILNLFLKTPIISVVELLIIFIIFYRILSKNIYSRQKENDIYLNFKKKINKPFTNIKRNLKNKDDYVYKKCHKCKKNLRLPLPDERGIKHVVCPKCKHKNSFLILKKMKVEIIKNK